MSGWIPTIYLNGCLARALLCRTQAGLGQKYSADPHSSVRVSVFVSLCVCVCVCTCVLCYGQTPVVHKCSFTNKHIFTSTYLDQKRLTKIPKKALKTIVTPPPTPHTHRHTHTLTHTNRNTHAPTCTHPLSRSVS